MRVGSCRRRVRVRERERERERERARVVEQWSRDRPVKAGGQLHV